MSAWSRAETLKDRCNRLLREIILAEYRPPTPLDDLGDELLATQQVLVWLNSIGIGTGSTQVDHLVRYVKDIIEAKKRVEDALDTSGPAQGEKSNG